MATRNDLEQLQAFARVDGAVVALLWTLSFACLIGVFHSASALLSLGWFAFGAASLVIAANRLRKYRDNILGGVISYARGLGYSMMTYLYASLLFAMAQYLYFQFIDGGFLMSHYSSADMTEALKLYGLTEEDVKVVLQNIAALRPIDIALQFFTTNLILAVFVSVPVALVMRRSRPGKR